MDVLRKELHPQIFPYERIERIEYLPFVLRKVLRTRVRRKYAINQDIVSSVCGPRTGKDIEFWSEGKLGIAGAG